MAKSSDVPMSTNGIESQDAIAYIGEKKHFEEVGTTLKNAPAYTPRRLRVITIGAGFSGLTLAHKFQHQHPELQGIVDHTIYESRNELGGTWLVNTYPGVVCDVPSHIYVRDPRPIYVFQMFDHATLISRPSPSTLILTGPISFPPARKYGLT